MLRRLESFALALTLFILVAAVAPWPVLRSQMVSAQQEGESEQSAAMLLASARRFLQEGAYVDSALVYLQVLDRYPRSPDSNTANLGLREIEEVMLTGGIAAEEIDRFATSMPRFEDLNSPEAKLTLVDFVNAKAEGLEAVGESEAAKPLYRTVYDWSASVIADTDSDPALIGHMWRHIESADKLGAAEFLAAREKYEKYASEEETTVRSWAALWISTHYIEESAVDRDSLESRYAQLREKATAATLQEVMRAPHTYGWIKSECLFGLGHAAFRMGDHADALAYFDEASGADAGHGLGAMKSSFAASVTREVIYTENPDAGLAALSTHLEKYENSPYRDDALIRMGKLYERRGDLVAAEEAYRMVVQENADPASTEKAADLLLRMEGR